MIHGHGGNINDVARQLNCRPSEIVDMSSNINPLGPPPGLLQYLRDHLVAVTRLPEVDAGETVKRFGRFLDIDSNRLLAGNGTSQFIYALPGLLDIRKALIVGPTYADYEDACRLQGIPCTHSMAVESNEFMPGIDNIEQHLDAVDTVFICNPNNPTGALIPSDSLRNLCRNHPEKNFIIDESYLDFVPDAEDQSMVHSGLDNVIVLLSISKIFKIPGLRIGFITAAEDRIQQFKQYLLPWSVNSLAQLAINYICCHDALIRAFISETRTYTIDQRQKFQRAVGHADRFRLFNSQTPFVLIKISGGLSARHVWQHLAREKILIRRCSNIKGLSERYVRISLKTEDKNKLLASRLVDLSQNSAADAGSLKELRVA